MVHGRLLHGQRESVSGGERGEGGGGGGVT